MMEGLRPNLGGSVIAMRAWPQLSPCKVVLGLTAKDDSLVEDDSANKQPSLTPNNKKPRAVLGAISFGYRRRITSSWE